MLDLENCAFSSASVAIYPVHSWSQTGTRTGLSLTIVQKFGYSQQGIRGDSELLHQVAQRDVFCAFRPELFW